MPAQSKMTILHIIDGLHRNGKTILLKSIIANMPEDIQHIVITTNFYGAAVEEFRSMGVVIHSLFFSDFKKKPLLTIKHIYRLFFLKGVDIAICWSGLANILSSFLKIRNIPVIWTIHNEYVFWTSKYKRIGVIVSSYLSKTVPYKIICCSIKTYKVYKDIHKYHIEKLEIISNGIDLYTFVRNDKIRIPLRKKFNLSKDTIVIVSALRMRPFDDGLKGDKDIESLLKVIKIVCSNSNNAVFILFGHNITWRNQVLKQRIKELDLEKQLLLLGYQKDVAAIYSCADLYLSTSKNEGLQLTLLEAMACGLIPVCTNFGDTEKLIGSIGRVVDKGDVESLATAILDISKIDAQEKERKAFQARNAIKESYDIKKVAAKYTMLARMARQHSIEQR